MIEPTDEQVERAKKAADLLWSEAEVRNMLRAALNPPPAPEIEVTKKMRKAGYNVLNYKYNWETPEAAWETVAKIYRAMEAARPKELNIKARMIYDKGTMHWREFDSEGHHHRRKGE